jgi:tetratricopeptide (TPR) repeat protein
MRTALLFLCVALTAYLPAAAQDRDPERARVHFEAGTSAFAEGDYTLAIHEFQAAYAITEHPDLLFNIYSAAERAGMLVEAEQALAQYLELGRPGRERRSLTRRLARLRVRVAEERSRAETAPPAVAVEVSATPSAPLEPAVSEPAPVAEAPALDLGTPEVAPPAERPFSVHPAAIGTLVGAGVLFASFGAFAVLSEVEDQSLAGRCRGEAGGQCGPEQVRTLEALNLVADISWIAGAAAAATGVALAFVLPADDAGASLAVLPYASPDGAGAGVVGRW